MINNQNRAYFIRTFLNVIKLTNESKYIICNTLISIPGHICAYDITFLLARVCGLFMCQAEMFIYVNSVF